MPQTLLALLALGLAAFLTLNQQRLTVRSQTNAVTDEVELAAAGLASEILAFIEARSFDENTTPQAIHAAQEVPSSSNQFTQSNTFGATDRGDGGCDFLHPAVTPECDDVDDVDGIDWTPATIDLSHGRTLAFEVRTEVYYVDTPQSMEVASGRTLHKRIVLDVRSPYVDGDEALGLVRMTRVVSYDPVKAEMDYENTDGYGPIGSDGGATTSETAG